MLKRIFIVALLTGTGQIAMVFSLKAITRHLNTQQIAAIAQVDALIILLINTIALGLQSVAMRNIVIQENWKIEYKAVQSARITLGSILFLLGFICFIKWEYCTFFLAPLFALSGDYALYAVGKPITGALFACIRLLVPYIFLLLTAYFYPDHTGYIFLASWGGIYLLSNQLIARSLKVPFLVWPKLNSLKLYFQSLPLGVVSIGFYFIGIGLVLIIPYFYPYAIQVTAFVGLKFYIVYKGILRIIHQAFFKEMIHDEWCLRVDQLSLMVAIIFLSCMIFFPQSFIIFFFGKAYLRGQTFFLILAFSATFYSFNLSAATRTLIDKKDVLFASISSIAAFTTIMSTIIFSFFNYTTLGIGISILLGEFFLMLALAKISTIKNLVKPRLRFFLSSSIVMIIPFILRFLFGDNINWLFFSLFLISLFLYLKNIKIFTKSYTL